MKNFRRSVRAAALALALAACAGVPRTQDPLLERRLPLDAGAMAYVLVTMPEARPILDHVNIGGYSSAQVSEILDKTRLVAAALYSRESGEGIRAAAWGDYPSFRAGLAFGMSRDWKRRRSDAAGKSYWHSPAYRVSLALGRDQVFAALAAPEAEAPPVDPFSRGPGVELPEGFDEFRRGASLALWMDRPAEFLDRFLSSLRIPIRIPAEQLMAGFSSLPAAAADTVAGEATDAEAPGTLYEIRLRVKLGSETTARNMMTLLATARFLIFQAANQGGIDQDTFELLNLLFTRPAVRDGASLTLYSPPLDGEGLALLFTLFSIYS